jgi:hypothetical protein
MCARYCGDSENEGRSLRTAAQLTDEEKFCSRLGAHAQEEAAIRKPVDICRTVYSLPIANGNIGDFEIELCGAEQKIKIAKWVDFAKV